jgi:hypothetical protein
VVHVLLQRLILDTLFLQDFWAQVVDKISDDQGAKDEGSALFPASFEEKALLRENKVRRVR